MNIEKIRRALRINGDHLDDELRELEEAAKAELVRSGCNELAVDEGTPLVDLAVVTFIKAQMSEDANVAARYTKSFETLEDAIRRSEHV